MLRASFISSNLQILSCDNAGIVKVNTIASKEVDKAEQEEEELQKREELFLKEQEFQKALQRNDYKEALRLALALSKPYHFRVLVEKIMKVQPEYEATLTELLSKLEVEDIGKLLSYVREWNLIGRTFIPAQVVMHVLLRDYSFDVLARVKGIEEYVNTLLAYNKRHLEVRVRREYERKRTDRLLQNTYVVDYVLQNMMVLEAE